MVLLVRGKPVVPTPQGEILLRHAKALTYRIHTLPPVPPAPSRSVPAATCVSPV